MSLHDITAKTLEGEEKNLADYKDQVLLVVNTASECGSTPQYAGLEALWREYKDKGFVLLGFPSNDFGGQEPGTKRRFATFCTKKLRRHLPAVREGEDGRRGQSPVYRYLAADHGEPKWNFHKYLVSKKGR
jgi:glutathione peroxidase